MAAPARTAALRRAGGPAACLLACAGAGAQWQLSGSVGIDSDGRFRGVSAGDSKPVWRAGLNVDAPGGGYAGMSATRIESVYGERHVQVVPYAGWVIGGRGGTTALDIGATWTHVAGDAAHDDGQGYVGLRAERWQARLSGAPDHAGQHVSAAYAELDGQAPVTPRARVFAHLGLLGATRVPSPGASRSRLDLRVGAAVSFGDSEPLLAWSGAHHPGPDPPPYRGRRAGWVVGTTWFF